MTIKLDHIVENLKKQDELRIDPLRSEREDREVDFKKEKTLTAKFDYDKEFIKRLTRAAEKVGITDRCKLRCEFSMPEEYFDDMNYEMIKNNIES